MSNALLALLYSASASAPAATAASTASPTASPAPVGQQSSPGQDLMNLLNNNSSSSTRTENVASASIAQPSAALSASSSLLALLTPPTGPTASGTPQPPSSPLAALNRTSTSTPAALGGGDSAPPQPQPPPPGPPPAIPASLLQALNGPPSHAGTPPPHTASALSPSLPAATTPQPATANSLLAALPGPASAAATPPPAETRQPVPAAPAQSSLPVAAAASPSPAPAEASSQPPSTQELPSLLQDVFRSSHGSTESTPSERAAGGLAEASAPTTDKEQEPSQPAAPVEQATETYPTDAQASLPAQTEVDANTVKPAATIPPGPSLPIYTAPKSSRDRLPVQRATHQITKLTTTSGTSLSDNRTSGLTLLEPTQKQNHFHLDLTRLQPAGIDTLHRSPLQAIGIALLPQPAAANATPSAVKTASNLVATLPLPEPATAASLNKPETLNAGSIVLYTLSRARIRAVHRETGARAMLSPPPTSSFTLSSNAKIVRLISGYSSSGGSAAAGNDSVLVVAAIIQDGLRAEEGGEEGEKVEFYLCAWGLGLDFGRLPAGGEGQGQGQGVAPPKTEARVLVMASLPRTTDVDPDETSSPSRDGSQQLPSIRWETEPAMGSSVGPYGSLLLTTAGEDAELWRVDVERCECRTGFPLEVLQKGKGVVRLGFVDAQTIFASTIRANAPVLVSVAEVNSNTSELNFIYAQSTRTSTQAVTLDLPASVLKEKIEPSSISFFAALPGVAGQRQSVVILGLHENTHVLILQLPTDSFNSSETENGETLPAAKVLASWHFDGPTNPEGPQGSNLLLADTVFTHTLILAQPERSSIFVLPLSWTLAQEIDEGVVRHLHWTECAVPEPISDFVLDVVRAGEANEEQQELALTSSYQGGVHVVRVPAALLGELSRSIARDDSGAIGKEVGGQKEDEEKEAVAAGTPQSAKEITVPALPVLEPKQATPVAQPAVPSAEKPVAETSQPTTTPKAEPSKAAASTEATTSASTTQNGLSVAPTTATPFAPEAQSLATPAAPVPAPTVTPQRTGTPAKDRAAKVASGENGKGGSRSRTGSQVRKEDAAAAKTTTATAAPASADGGSNAVSAAVASVGPVDLDPVLSLLKQQFSKVVLPEVKATTRAAVQEYLGNTLPEAVLAALPHELHRFLLRPDLSAHLIRTITTGVLPDVQKTAVDTVTRVLAPEFEEVFNGLESKFIKAVEWDMVNLRKDVVAEQGEALVETNMLVKAMTGGMAELRGAVLGMNTATARIEKVLIKVAERAEQREAETVEVRTRLFELIAMQQRKMETMETSFEQQLAKMQGLMEEQRLEIRSLLQQQQVLTPQQAQPPPPPPPPQLQQHRSWTPAGLMQSPGMQPPMFHMGPPPPPPPSGSGFLRASQGPPPPPPPPSNFGPFSYQGMPPVGPEPSEGLWPPPTPFSQTSQSAAPPPPRPSVQVPENVEAALIQALGAPGIEQDSTILRETLQMISVRRDSILDALNPDLTRGPLGYEATPEDDIKVSQPVLLALVHRLAMALDARARLGPNPSESVVRAGTGGALEVTLAVPWLETAAALLEPHDARIEQQYRAVAGLIREALWRAVQGLRGGPDEWWNEKRVQEYVLKYLWVRR
ncbi:hypothetical protein V8E36_006674 [Tilletia maclaganii]